MSKRLNNLVYRIILKSGLKTNINTSATKAVAKQGEFHYATDSDELFIYNGTENVIVPSLPASTDTPFTGTFENGTGDTVTVKNGIITDVS